jgi:glycosyltransferase involved in cell wall biosynthesis
VQSSGKNHYIEKQNLPNLNELEVLPNWMPSISTDQSFSSHDFYADLQHTVLRDKKVFVYAGNLGEAQGIEHFAQLMLNMKDRSLIGFLIIGRGSRKEWLQEYVKIHQIQNALILDEVDLITLSMYYRQCCAGLVFLDPNHQSHNIPGKFISYLEAGLPVAACVNSGNDLINIIKKNMLGLVADNLNQFSTELEQFIAIVDEDRGYQNRTREFYEAHYRPSAIAQQIVTALSRLSR